MVLSAKVALTSLAVILLSGAVMVLAPLQTLNALTPAHTYRKTSDLHYGPDPRHRLDVYAPSKAAGLSPVVVFFYGGTWNSGERASYAFVGEALASRGIVAVLADYRLYPQVRYPDFLEDGARAVAWTGREVKRFGGDPDRLFVMGHSAGGYNAAMIALDSRLMAPYGTTAPCIRGLIGLAAPYDFIPIENPDAKPVFFFPDTPPDSQPINHVRANSPPALLIASTDDYLVNPTRNTGGLAKKMRNAGVKVTEIYSDRTNHFTLVATLAWPLRPVFPTLDLIERFVSADGARTENEKKAAAK